MPLVALGLTWELVRARPSTAAALPPVPIAEESPLVAPTPIVGAEWRPALAVPALRPVAPVAVVPPVAVVAVEGVPVEVVPVDGLAPVGGWVGLVPVCAEAVPAI